MDDADEPGDELAARRESGGARASKKKNQERENRRSRGKWSATEFLKRYRALGAAPTDPGEVHGWLLKVHALAVEEAITDPGPPPEQRREQIARLTTQLNKIVDMAKMSEQIGKLRRALEELKSGAAEVDPGTAGGPGAAAPKP